jgi:aspartate-semialdehyde dehydrogenase
MTRIAILQPTTLLGQELRETLERRTSLWDQIELLSRREEEVGTLAELVGTPTFVRRAEPGSLDGIDLAFFCDTIGLNAPLLQTLPESTTAIVLSLDEEGVGLPVAGRLNAPRVRRGMTLVSPHPAAVALSQLLGPLCDLGLEQAIATVLLPASVCERAGLDEVFEQTRKIVTFTQPIPDAVFGRQMAFNLLPGPPASVPLRQLRELLPIPVEVELQLVRAGVFHSLAISLFCRFGSDPGSQRLQRAFATAEHVRFADSPATLGPIDAAAEEGILLGSLVADAARPASYWLWAVMDNLTRGGALNALEIAERVLAEPLPS